MLSLTELGLWKKHDRYSFDISVCMESRLLAEMLSAQQAVLDANGVQISDGRVSYAFQYAYVSLFPEYREDSLWILMYGLAAIERRLDGEEKVEVTGLLRQLNETYDTLAKTITFAKIGIRVHNKALTFEEEGDCLCSFLEDKEDVDEWDYYEVIEKINPYVVTGVWQFSFDGCTERFVWMDNHGTIQKEGSHAADAEDQRVEFSDFVVLRVGTAAFEVPCCRKDDTYCFASEGSKPVDDYRCLKKLGENEYEILFPPAQEATASANGLDVTVVYKDRSEEYRDCILISLEFLDYSRNNRHYAAKGFKSVFRKRFNHWITDTVYEIKTCVHADDAMHNLVLMLGSLDVLFDFDTCTTVAAEQARRKKNGTLSIGRAADLDFPKMPFGMRRLRTYNLDDHTAEIVVS